jgi:hypothetical protein
MKKRNLFLFVLDAKRIILDLYCKKEFTNRMNLSVNQILKIGNSVMNAAKSFLFTDQSELKKESKLQDFVETSDRPFSQGKSITGLGNKKLRDRHQRERERQRKLDRIEKEKDPDIKAELRKGNIVEIIEDSMDY